MELQPEFVLQDKYRNGEGKNIRAIKYRADFRYIDMATGEVVVEDVKGRITDVYGMKKKMFELKFHPMTIKEVRA